MNLFLSFKRFLISLKDKVFCLFSTRMHPKYFGYKIGKHTYGFPKVMDFSSGANLEIGKFCSIAKDVTILLGGEHDFNCVSTYPFFEKYSLGKRITKSKGDVIIGNDVWIGAKVIILSGVKIGDGAVIGCGTVVSRDILPYSIVVGNPGKTIKKRFDSKTIKKLLEMKWWDWDYKKIKANSLALTSHLNSDFFNLK